MDCITAKLILRYNVGILVKNKNGGLRSTQSHRFSSFRREKKFLIVQQSGLSDVVLNLFRLAPKGTNPASASQNVLNSDLKKSRFVPFEANIANVGPKSGNPGLESCKSHNKDVSMMLREIVSFKHDILEKIKSNNSLRFKEDF